MSPREAMSLAITGLAGVSPVGLNMTQTCAALRAGISRFSDHPFYQPRLPTPPLVEPEPARVAAVPVGALSEPLEERLLRLVLLPMQELQASGGLHRADLRATQLFLCLPDEGPGRAVSGLTESFTERFLSGLGIEVGALTLVRQGRIGVLKTLDEAARRLNSGACEFAVVLCADSYLDGRSMAWLDERWRLKSERNVDGFIPGECAALLLLELPRQATARKARVLGRIAALGEGQEPYPLGGERRASGGGLARAISEAMTAWEPDRPFWTICDLNGESYRSQEWGALLSRLAPRLQHQQDLWHPADRVGDVGTASPGLYIAMACHAFNRRSAKADAALVWCAAEEGARAACRVERPD